MLLAYWQYFKRTDLMNFDWDKVGNSQLQCLDPEQVDFMKKIIGLLNERGRLLFTLSWKNWRG